MREASPEQGPFHRALVTSRLKLNSVLGTWDRSAVKLCHQWKAVSIVRTFRLVLSRTLRMYQMLNLFLFLFFKNKTRLRTQFFKFAWCLCGRGIRTGLYYTELPEETASIASTRKRTFFLNSLNEDRVFSEHEEFLTVRARSQSSCGQDATEGQGWLQMTGRTGWPWDSFPMSGFYHLIPGNSCGL